MNSNNFVLAVFLCFILASPTAYSFDQTTFETPKDEEMFLLNFSTKNMDCALSFAKNKVYGKKKWDELEQKLKERQEQEFQKKKMERGKILNAKHPAALITSMNQGMEVLQPDISNQNLFQFKNLASLEGKTGILYGKVTQTFGPGRFLMLVDETKILGCISKFPSKAMEGYFFREGSSFQILGVFGKPQYYTNIKKDLVQAMTFEVFFAE